MSTYPPQPPPTGYPPAPGGPPGMPPPPGQPGAYGQPPQYGQPGPYPPPPYGPPPQSVPPYGQYAAPSPGQPGYQWGGAVPAYPFASFGQRLGATLIDGLVLLGILIVPYILAVALVANSVKTTRNFNGTTSTAVNGGGIALAVLLYIVIIVVSLLYEPLQIARKNDKNGQTIGRRAVKIRITNLDGGPISTGQAWGRFLFRAFFSGSIFYLGYLWVLWDPMKQGWHDKVAKTLVLRA